MNEIISGEGHNVTFLDFVNKLLPDEADETKFLNIFERAYQFQLTLKIWAHYTESLRINIRSWKFQNWDEDITACQNLICLTIYNKEDLRICFCCFSYFCLNRFIVLRKGLSCVLTLLQKKGKQRFTMTYFSDP